MKTKIIPFDLETAKKIQAGEIKGRIKTRNGEDVRIIAWDRKNEHHTPIIALVDYGEKESAIYCSENGTYDFSNNDLVLEVPDNEPQFKPFDKVLVRSYGSDNQWEIGFYSHQLDDEDGHWYVVLGAGHYQHYQECIQYEGNEHLVGTTNNPE